MTATTAAPTRAKWRLTNRGVAKAEWIKLTSVRSNIITLLSAGAVMVAFGMLFSALTGSTDTVAPPPPQGGATGSFGIAYAGLNLAQLVLGVLGALLITSEYSSGLIRTMFAAVPKRVPVLVAKSVVVALSTWVVMTIASFATFFAAQAVYAGSDPTYVLTDDGVLRAVLGVGVYGAGIALMGLALGFLLRSTALAVSVLVAGLLVVPGLSGLLPHSISEPLVKVLPSNAGSSFTQLVPSADRLSAGAGLAVFAIWILGLLAIAAFTLSRRDA